MRVFRVHPAGRSPDRAAIFLGSVRTQPVVGETDSERHRVTEVTFEAGARTRLHRHETDQVLIITAGRGVVGTPADRFDVEPGDVVLIPAGEPHHHGAAEDHDMTHLSILGPGQMTIIE